MTLRDIGGGGGAGFKNLASTSFHGGFLTSTKNPLSIKEEITSTTSSIRSRNNNPGGDFHYSAALNTGGVLNLPSLNTHYGDHLQGLSSVTSGNLIKGLD